jgi:phosphatidate cytidylyltransferase
VTDGPVLSRTHGELGKRLVSAIVMAALAIAAVVLGGWPFVVFWAAAAIGVFWEWSAMTAGGAVVARVVGILALAAAALAGGFGQLYIALTAVAAGAAGIIASAEDSRHRIWRAAGVVYAGVVLLAPVVLRGDRASGLIAILFLFAVVWSTDILGYFVGRAIGGPRLAPPVSPNKTWSGACGGALGAVAAGVAVVFVAGDMALLPAAAVALALSVASQAGDLFESAVKRRFGVKDASHVIPGHGGLMDRLDGFIAAGGVAALVGVLRGGLDAPARGFLLW